MKGVVHRGDWLLGVVINHFLLIFYLALEMRFHLSMWNSGTSTIWNIVSKLNQQTCFHMKQNNDNTTSSAVSGGLRSCPSIWIGSPRLWTRKTMFTWRFGTTKSQLDNKIALTSKRLIKTKAFKERISNELQNWLWSSLWEVLTAESLSLNKENKLVMCQTCEYNLTDKISTRLTCIYFEILHPLIPIFEIILGKHQYFTNLNFWKNFPPTSWLGSKCQVTMKAWRTSTRWQLSRRSDSFCGAKGWQRAQSIQTSAGEDLGASTNKNRH